MERSDQSRHQSVFPFPRVSQYGEEAAASPDAAAWREELDLELHPNEFDLELFEL